jgi:uncharacterized membrane protein
MTRTQNMSVKFRTALKGELPAWVQQGILSQEAAGRLSQAYQLDNLKAESSRLLSAVIYTVGSLLLGGALITFVAANWEAISTPWKLAILFAALVGFHSIGYYLWHQLGWRRLGHALIFCGCLVFGANIGLVAQIFHIRGNWYGAFGAWALGSLVMAWAIRSWITGLLALVTSVLWVTGFANDGYETWANIYPFALAATLLPLAWKLRSQMLYAGVLLGINVSACVIAGVNGGNRQVLLAMTAGGLLIWVVSEFHRLSNWHKEFANITAGLGLSVLAVAAYVWSFQGFWEHASLKKMLSPLALLLLVLSLVTSGLLLRQATSDKRRIALGVLGTAVLLCASALAAGWAAVQWASLFIILANLAALILAVVIIGIGISEERRAPFWLGSLYIVLLILSRFLEYKTSLLLKSAAFLACGIAVIVAGISYEKYLRRNASPADSLEKTEAVYE